MSNNCIEEKTNSFRRALLKLLDIISIRVITAVIHHINEHATLTSDDQKLSK